MLLATGTAWVIATLLSAQAADHRLSSITSSSGLVSLSSRATPYNTSSGLSQTVPNILPSSDPSLSSKFLKSEGAVHETSQSISNPLATFSTAVYVPSPKVYDAHVDTSFCNGRSWGELEWKQLGMKEFLKDKAIGNLLPDIKKHGLMEAWSMKMTNWTKIYYSCNSRGDGCDEQHDLIQFCYRTPRWTLLVNSLSQFTLMISAQAAELAEVADNVVNDMARFPQTFAPDNKTAQSGGSSGPSGAQIADNVFGWLGAIASFIPFVGPEVKAISDGVKGTVAIAGMVAKTAQMSDEPDKDKSIDVEKRFGSWAGITENVQDFRNKSNEATDKILDLIHTPGTVQTARDLDIVVDAIIDGNFVGGYSPPKRADTYHNTYAILAATGLNALWRWDGVILVRVSREDFQRAGMHYDPCYGANLFYQDTKNCETGDMIVLQRIPQDKQRWDYTDTGFFKVGGFLSLDKYHLSKDLIIRSCMMNRGRSRSSQTPEDLFKDIKDVGQDIVKKPLEELIKFKLPVCDMTHISFPKPLPPDTKFCLRKKKNWETCIFYTMMEACRGGIQKYGDEYDTADVTL